MLLLLKSRAGVTRDVTESCKHWTRAVIVHSATAELGATEYCWDHSWEIDQASLFGCYLSFLFQLINANNTFKLIVIRFKIIFSKHNVLPRIISMVSVVPNHNACWLLTATSKMAVSSDGSSEIFLINYSNRKCHYKLLKSEYVDKKI